MIRDNGIISLNRVTAKIAGPCDFCTSHTNPPEHFPMLMIEGEKNFITCCEFHEGLMLMTLLNNYVKRKRRNSTAGFVGPVPKEGEIVVCD
jgi:hypothetical protein